MASIYYLVLVKGITKLDGEYDDQLRDFFSRRFPSAHLKIFDLSSTSISSQSFGHEGLRQKAKVLLEELLPERAENDQDQNGDIPVAFIGHDIGGSLIKQALVLATEELSYQWIARNTAAVIFLGTPHNADTMSSWELQVFRLLSASRLPSERLLQLLHELPAALDQLAKDFAAVSGNFHIMDFFKGNDGASPSAARPEPYPSTSHFPKWESVGVTCSHEDLWLFKDGDPKSESICGMIERCSTGPLPLHRRYHEFLRFISHYDTDIHQLRPTKAAPGSMDWITQNRTYLDWISGSATSILHVLGPPGAGSTVLTIKILSLLQTMNQTTKDATIVSFYFKASDVRCRSLRMLYLSLSHQLLTNKPALFQRRNALCMALMAEGYCNENNLWVLLKSLLASHVCGPVFCILHAVQYCESPLESLLKELIALGSSEGESPSLKILLTSSESYELDLPVEHYRSISLADEAGMESAVKQAIRARMTSLAQKKPVWQGYEETAIERLCESGITYLEAMQKIDELEDARTRSTKAAIARKLEDIPSSLDDIYERILKRIHSVEDGWVESALAWLVCAVRPLRIPEMAVAVALEDLDSRLDVAHRGHMAKAFKLLPQIIPWDIWGDLSGVVGPLVKIVDDEIHPIHQSLRQFLSRKYASSDQAIHRRILTECLDYVEMVSEGCPYLKDQVDVDDSTWTSMSSEMEYAFLSYAALYWPKHYERAKLESTDIDRIFEFLEKNVRTWSRVYRYLDTKTSSPRLPLLDTPLKVACKFGISALVDKALQSTGPEENRQDALELAAYNGHLGVVRKLIAKGVQSSKSILGLAAEAGFADILDHLLQADPAIIDGIDASGSTALMRAARRGHGDAVLLLLGKGANVNARTANKSTALHVASRLGLCDIVRILVNAGADLVVVGNSGYDALRIAAAGGFEDIVKLLIECGIDAEGSTVEGETALHLAALFGHHRIISLLISEAGAVVNSVDKEGLTPLHLASMEGHLDVVQLLLEAEAYPSAQPTKDEKDEQDGLKRPATLIPGILTPLQLAAQGGHADVVREFLTSRLDLPVSDRQTAANVAATAGHLDIVENLMNSLSIEWEEWEGDTTLHQAAKCGLTNVVAELLKYQQFQETINDTNGMEWTPLHEAASAGHVEVVRDLISHGAEIDRKDRNGDMPIHLACRKCHLSVVQELLTSEKKTADEDRRGALHLAVWHGHVDIVKVLLQFEETGPGENDSAHDGDEVITKSLFEINYKHDDEYNPNEEEKHLDGETGSACMVRLLCQAGAHVNATNSSKQTPLCLAARRGDILAAKVLLEHGAYVDAADADGATPLYSASYYGYEKVVRLLLTWDPDLTAQTTDYKGWTALHAAMDHAGITKFLLDAGADPNFQDAEGSISLTFAASSDYTEVVSVLLEYHVDVDSANSAKSTPLHHAARFNRLASVKLLVKAGASCDAKDSDGNTPLHIAIVKEYTDVVEYLLDHVADMEIQSDVYGTPLTAATVVGNVTIAQLLISRGAKVNTLGGPYESALESAAWQGEREMIQLLLEHGADVNARGGKFGSPLQAGIEDHNSNTVRILLEAGADVGVEVDRYNTTIQMAAAYDAADIVELLLEYGADVNVTGGMFGTPLNAAVESGSKALVERLLGHQADPNIRVDNLTALHTAARRGLPEIIELLVTKGADIKVKDDNGRSILSYAVVWESKSIIDYLLSKPEIDVNGKDSAARTPLLAAVRQGSGFVEIVEALLATGADVSARDSEAKTPLIVAATSGNVEMVKLLLDYKGDPTITDGCGRGPLYWACRSGKSMEIFDSIEVALRGRSELDAQCEMAFCAAVASKQSEILAKLLAIKGVDPNKPDRDGWTPQYTARRYGFEEIEQQLIAANPVQRRLSLQRPSGWHCTEKSPALLVSPEAQEVSVGYDAPNIDNLVQPRGIAVSDHCMPGTGVYYFEVLIKNSLGAKIIGVGFCEERAPLNRMLGWDEGSWGYHGDDGKTFDNGRNTEGGDTYGPQYDTGDVIGCGVNFGQRIAFFTKNGVLLGRAFENIQGKLYPAVCFDTTEKGCRISVNFGERPFMYSGSLESPRTLRPENEDSDSEYEWLRPVRRRKLRRSRRSPRRRDDDSSYFR